MTNRSMVTAFIILCYLTISVWLFAPSYTQSAERNKITYHRIDNLTQTFSPIPNLRIVCIWTEHTEILPAAMSTQHSQNPRDMEIPAGMACMQLGRVDFDTYQDMYP